MRVKRKEGPVGFDPVHLKLFMLFLCLIGHCSIDLVWWDSDDKQAIHAFEY